MQPAVVLNPLVTAPTLVSICLERSFLLSFSFVIWEIRVICGYHGKRQKPSYDVSGVVGSRGNATRWSAVRIRTSAGASTGAKSSSASDPHPPHWRLPAGAPP